MKLTFFVDMDGTIAEWRDDVSVAAYYQKGYFANLRPNDGILNFVKDLTRVFPCYIVSACTTEMAKKEKGEWLDRFLPEIKPEHRIFVPVAVNKSKYVQNFLKRGLTQMDYLLDDYSKNLLEWVEAGASGIKVINQSNGRGIKWKGPTISAFAPREDEAL